MITQQLPSYPYQQYSDDENVSAFFTAYNELSQTNLDTVNSVELPIFLNQSGALLDWCATGIYGIPRQNIPFSNPQIAGLINTFELNTEVLNKYKLIQNSNVYQATDLIYQRIIQWNTFKGDGFNFTIPWLKKRVQRFLTGAIFPDQTYQISVRFTSSTAVTISIHPYITTLVGGSLYNENDYNELGISFNTSVTNNVVLTDIFLAPILQAAINNASGILQLPFQYTFTVEILAT